MPHQLESYQIAEKTGAGRMVIAILWATLLGAVSTFWIELYLYYKHGATSRYFSTWRISSSGF